MQRVVIAAGGTAGHVVPAMAVAAELRDRGAHVSFVGARGRMEAELVPAAGYEIDLLDVTGLDRSDPVAATRAALRAARAIAAARRLLRHREPAVVMGGGGFVAGPAGVAALSLRLPLVLTEADRHLGLANRLLAGRARRVCLAFPVRGREGDRYVVTGRPVPRAVLEADRERARERFGIGSGERCLLVFGGSQGARSINVAAVEGLAEGGGERTFHVLHLSGRRDHAELAERIATAQPPRYTLLAYEPDLGDALAACDLVLARAGGSIFEIAAAGRPAILVPYPHAAADHQRANAAWMRAAGGAVVIEDRDLSGDGVAALAAQLLADDDRLAGMAAAAADLARPDAAARVADEILAAAR